MAAIVTGVCVRLAGTLSDPSFVRYRVGSCNLLRMALEPVSDSIWLVDGELVSFYGFPYPTRSVIVRLENDALWVWSPVETSPDLVEAVDRLGSVAHLVSPNKLHHLYLQDWTVRYPDARLWGPASTIRKRRDLAFRDALTDTPPADWGPDLDQAWFRGSPAMDEIVFLHRPSRTVIVADLIESLDQGFLRAHWRWWQRPLARLDGISADRPGAPREWRWSFIDRAPARRARDKVLGWDCERVIMAHGDWERADGHAFLARALAWLGREPIAAER